MAFRKPAERTGCSSGLSLSPAAMVLQFSVPLRPGMFCVTWAWLEAYVMRTCLNPLKNTTIKGIFSSMWDSREGYPIAIWIDGKAWLKLEQRAVVGKSACLVWEEEPWQNIKPIFLLELVLTPESHGGVGQATKGWRLLSPWKSMATHGTGLPGHYTCYITGMK